MILNRPRKYSIHSKMKLDAAVAKLLDIEPASASVSSAGGGGCSSASTSKIVAKLQHGTGKAFFMKTGSGKAAKLMFKGTSAKTSAQEVISRLTS